MIIQSLIVLALFAPATQDAATMKAIRYHEHGPASVLKLEDAPKPAPGEGEMLVRVHAAGVNPVDWKIRAGGRSMAKAYIPGFDVSGVVEHVGPNVTKFKAGDEIFAMVDLRRGGCYAEYATVKESEAAIKPAKVTHVGAASVPLVALTAWQALFDTAHLDKGQTVLIHGGAGGVGSMAVQLAKWKGAHVIATASQENLDFLKQLGADEVIDYRNEKFEELAKDVDVVLDTVGGDTQARSWPVLKKDGILVSIVGQPSQQKAQELGARGAGILVRVNADELAQISKLIDDGKLKPVVTHVFTLSEAAKAHEQSETRHTRGKIVLQVGQP
jgi:NADPH:quinone reductase-like Zn-dependent oxidoreductase